MWIILSTTKTNDRIEYNRGWSVRNEKMGATRRTDMTELHFKCKKCRKYFDCDVGKISFPPKEERPRFEKSIFCPKCGTLSADQVELTELGQTQLSEVFMSSLR